MAKSNSTVELMDAADWTNYAGVLADRKEEKRLAPDAQVSYVTQVFTMGNVYIGAWIIVDGPTIAASYGPTPAYRYWLFVDTEWEEKLFNNSADLYRHVANMYGDIVRIRMYFRNQKNQMELHASSTLTLKAYLAGRGVQ